MWATDKSNKPLIGDERLRYDGWNTNSCTIRTDYSSYGVYLEIHGLNGRLINAPPNFRFVYKTTLDVLDTTPRDVTGKELGFVSLGDKDCIALQS